MSFFDRPEFDGGNEPAYRPETVLADGELAVATGTDVALGRAVRLIGCAGPAAEAFSRRVEALACLDHPGLLPVHETERLSDGAALAVVAHLPEARSDPAALVDPARLAVLAGALAHAAARGVELPAASLERVFVAGERTCWDFTQDGRWEGEPPGEPGPATTASSRRLAIVSRPADAVPAFGRFLLRLLRTTGRRSRYLAAIARAARAGRYPDARALADDLERLAAGDPVSVTIDGPLRRMRRLARRHPVVLAIAGVLAAGVVGGGLLLRAARQRRLDRLRDEATAVLATIRGARERAAPHLRAAREAHAARMKLWDEREAAYHQTTALQPTEHERKLEQRLREVRGERAAARLLAEPELGAIVAAPERLTDEVAAAFPAEVKRAREAAARARRGLGALKVAEVEAAFRRAGFETGRTLSTETLGQLRDTARLARLLDDPDLPADRVAALRARLVPRGALVVSPLPEGVTATLHEINNGKQWTLGPGKSVAPGTHEVPAGNHLLVLTRARDRQRFRFPLLVRRGRTVRPDLRLPAAVPEGFVYCPPGPFYRGGPGRGRQRYRLDRMQKGFFLQRREVTVAEYREFLLALKGKGADVTAHVPLLATSNRMVRVLAGPELKVAVGLVKPDYPVFGIPHTSAAAYARWRGRRLPTEAEWERAARGAAGRPFPHGDAFSATLANVKGHTRWRYWSPVGQPVTDRSILGVLGLGGNVREWTGTKTADGLWILKGGSWGFVANCARCAGRSAVVPVNRDPIVGFRLAASAPSAR